MSTAAHAADWLPSQEARDPATRLNATLLNKHAAHYDGAQGKTSPASRVQPPTKARSATADKRTQLQKETVCHTRKMSKILSASQHEGQSEQIPGNSPQRDRDVAGKREHIRASRGAKLRNRYAAFADIIYLNQKTLWPESTLKNWVQS